MDLSVEKFRPFKGLTKEVIVRFFGRGRTMKRGGKFAAEGYLSDITITHGESDATVSSSCWASQTKNKAHKIFLAIDTSSYEPLEHRCKCAAGRGKCSHLCALYHYLCAGGAFLRSLEGFQDVQSGGEVARQGDDEAAACTSRPRTWGIPKRRVEPEVPIENIIFQKAPSMDKPFTPLPAAGDQNEPGPGRQPVENLFSVAELKQFRNKLKACEEESVLSRYLVWSSNSEDSGDSDTNATGDDRPERGIVLSSRFDQRRPGPVQYASCMKPVLDSINASVGQPSPVQIKEWCDQLVRCVCVPSEERLSICRLTQAQSSSPLWYRERVCRLTSSSFGLICKRRDSHMMSLVDQLLYKEPPVTVSALRQGRSMEPKIVEAYVAQKLKDECLVDVEETGLHIHPTIGYLAASPDQLVNDTSCEPGVGILEVKYLASVEGDPGLAIGRKSNYCLERRADQTCLKKSHSYYYQVQSQMACTGRSWCDFACMTKTGELFCERILFDRDFWAACAEKLTRFYLDFYAPEIVHPMLR